MKPHCATDLMVGEIVFRAGVRLLAVCDSLMKIGSGESLPQAPGVAGADIEAVAGSQGVFR